MFSTSIEQFTALVLTLQSNPSDNLFREAYLLKASILNEAARRGERSSVKKLIASELSLLDSLIKEYNPKI